MLCSYSILHSNYNTPKRCVYCFVLLCKSHQLNCNFRVMSVSVFTQTTIRSTSDVTPKNNHQNNRPNADETKRDWSIQIRSRCCQNVSPCSSHILTLNIFHRSFFTWKYVPSLKIEEENNVAHTKLSRHVSSIWCRPLYPAMTLNRLSALISTIFKRCMKI